MIVAATSQARNAGALIVAGVLFVLLAFALPVVYLEPRAAEEVAKL